MAVKKATVADFLAKKLKKDEEANKTIEIKLSSMDSVFEVKKPSDKQILDFIDSLGDTKNTKKIMEETFKLIYNNCPALKNKELHEQLDIQNPYDIIDVLFDFKDKQEIMEQFNKLIGLEDKKKKIDKEIKN
jgi:hypothetical protein